jgi:lipid II:glycine glycyltransferase (peptidoglycan interpeptide bridge formation enzyme)
VSVVPSNTEVSRFLALHLCKIAREENIVYLAVQPPRNHEVLAAALKESGFLTTTLNLAPNATVQIDLSQTLEQILSSMRKTTRYDVKASQRKGVTVREGQREDLGTFSELLATTAQRQHFAHPGLRYFEHVWGVFSVGGHIRMFVAEHEGEPVSAALIMAFGDTATYWKTGWSGEHGGQYPNEALQWSAIQWAKSQGYRYYDFGGIYRPLAIDLLAGKTDYNPKEHGTSFYKLGYGGEVKLLPEASAYVHNRLLRRIASRVSNMAAVSRMLGKLR